MGCGGSKAAEVDDTTASVESANRVEEADVITDDHHTAIHDRLTRLTELDAATKIPFILIELTGEADGEGEIEICGKDEYGAYEMLNDWLETQWGCEKLDCGDLSSETKIPFCSAQYKWDKFATAGEEGLNNMGFMTMRLVDFVCGQMSWTLAVVNGGNVGKAGEIREQQVMFKAPHPMNLVAPHMMIELRSAGFIQLSADLEEKDRDILDGLEQIFVQLFQVEPLDGYEEFSDKYYKTGDGVYEFDAESGDHNLGAMTTQVCDAVVGFAGWNLVSCNGGFYGESGEHREQQLVFRRDYNPLRAACHVLIVLRENGTVEVNGKDNGKAFSALDRWLQKNWQMERSGHSKAADGASYVRRYKGESGDMMKRAGEISAFFEKLGWEMQVAAQGMFKLSEGSESQKEQQLLFRPGTSEVGVIEPHIFFELYAGEGKQELYDDEEQTQVLANQHITLNMIGDRDEDLDQIDAFMSDYLGGGKDDDMRRGRSDGNIEAVARRKYHCDLFLSRGRYENNLAQWTMRLCDYMVDRLGWGLLACSLANSGEYGQFRSQQIVFRYEGDQREVPVSKSLAALDNSQWAGRDWPEYWSIPEVLNGEKVQKVAPCSDEEMQDLQVMIDSTFKRILTRDRRPDEWSLNDEEMPYRLEVVNAFRSENCWLMSRYQDCRSEKSAPDDVFPVKTNFPPTSLTGRMDPGEAYLYHGTNPSSAMSILKSGFSIDHAGSNVGAMFGNGVYLAECASKSDEYGRDDGGNTYPALMALLVCRAFVGKPHVMLNAGDEVEQAREAGFDCIIGDREAKVGTFKEFIFFDERQAYPEFTIIYRRQYEILRVPPALQNPKTNGTTGRYWQVRLDKAWKNVPPEVNKTLVGAMKAGEAQVSIKIGESEYNFDLNEKKQTNEKGYVRPLRAPMVVD